MKWNPGIEYELEDTSMLYSMAVGNGGKLHVWSRNSKGDLLTQGYDHGGKLDHALLLSAKFKHHTDRFQDHKDHDRGLLLVRIDGDEQLALSSPHDQRILLGSHVFNTWSVGWQASTKWLGIKKVSGQPKPSIMVRGKPGQIIAANYKDYSCKTVSIFDTTQIPFRVVVSEIQLQMEIRDMCYCELPGVGGALAVSGGNKNLSMCKLDSGEILWDRKLFFSGSGVCSDNGGRIYVSEMESARHWFSQTRIYVFSADSGSLLQVVIGNGYYHMDLKFDGAGDPDLSQNSPLRYIPDPGITVYGPDIKYGNDALGKRDLESVSGTVLQEFKDKKLGWARGINLCWDEHTKSIIIGHGSKISYFQIEF